MLTRCWSALFLGILVSSAAAQEKPLPKVVLVGDSIRMGYAPLVAKRLDGKAIVVSAKPNGEDSGNVLRNLDEWVIKEKPDVVHFNAGLHDLKLKDKSYQVPLVRLREKPEDDPGAHSEGNNGEDYFRDVHPDPGQAPRRAQGRLRSL